MALPFDFTMFQSEQFLVPFLFILAVVFGAVNASKVFGNKGVNFIVSLALALFAASNATLVQFMWSQFGSITIFFIAMFFVIFTLEAFGIRDKKGHPGKDSADALIINSVILLVLLSISYKYVSYLPSLPYIGGGENLLLLIFIAFILVIFWSAYKS